MAKFVTYYWSALQELVCDTSMLGEVHSTTKWYFPELVDIRSRSGSVVRFGHWGPRFEFWRLWRNLVYHSGILSDSLLLVLAGIQESTKIGAQLRSPLNWRLIYLEFQETRNGIDCSPTFSLTKNWKKSIFWSYILQVKIRKRLSNHLNNY